MAARQGEILVVGMEQEISEIMGKRLASPHSILMDAVMSRKKQVVPVLSRVARLWKAGG